MKTSLGFVSFVLLATATAQHDEPRPDGVIYGTAVAQDGQPARRIGLTAQPLGVPLSAVLPHTATNDKGEYRFEHIPWWGKYTVYADDEDAGYSTFSRTGGRTEHPEVELTPEHRKAKLKLYLPPKAGFVQIHLTNRRSGALISGMHVTVMSMEKPDSLLFSIGCDSNHVILVPPDTNVLLHVSSDGFREWDESVGRGKPINVPSGDRLKLAVQLEPSG